MKRLIFALLLVVMPLGPSLAVQPDEVLNDPVLEERARELSKGLRCLVCRNESIDESNATLARDLRLLVRERLVAGDSDDEVIDYVVDRYGEYVLLQPRASGSTWALWAAGPIMLLLAMGIALMYLRRRQSAPEPADGAGLSDKEKARLDDILKK
ncbi:cytochrome c-type biogenesis protein CcmH [Lutimaribacter sp. EGI FJ00015]|uniref:Cytochrome c-type biogenesis protein CcmH n=1 Tax=Lutimaribacter degradans TaxID=2945989 RepID=A0ACC5ZVK9_9RHOB|nr:cytochrome c-type biogenesis protein [Lutimaribacter sp. EGI FJ00013]MCM2562140.1 cytochrome c-type biogenesis protein CcmH [Lutimaribacter sp. EGI FJ00013]MCO0613293.1 cytochrome c-type biogenesis protein CcmH [Lutimaribacter sp. EGI FJ00015]MCO0636270.1 cytochrome c-type biogenesis protein CcmH [Lutimaribacter sp. EGI FJ00014]